MENTPQCCIGRKKPSVLGFISALGAIPKPESQEVRLIHDRSRPKDNSLNSQITESESFSYQTIHDALKHIKHKSFLAKLDIRKAYRQVPLHPSNYRATGLSWQLKLKEHLEFEFIYLYDTKLPFGASKAPEIFHRLSQSVIGIMQRKGYTVIAYLDDFLLIEDTYERCLQGFNTLIELLQILDFSINWGKAIYPCQFFYMRKTCITFVVPL